MFKNYIKIALRNIIKHKSYSFINIICLSLGVASSILLFLWIQDELSYDKFHKKGNQIYQVYMTVYTEKGDTTLDRMHPPVAEDLKNEFPEDIEKFTRILYLDKILLGYDQKKFIESGVAAADASIFDIFTFHLIKGNPQKSLSQPHSIILTEEMASKYFGIEEPMGKTISINNKFDFVVTGVMKNIPHQSHIKFKFLFPLKFAPELEYDLRKYMNNQFYSYLMLPDEVKHKVLEEKISRSKFLAKLKTKTKLDIKALLVPLKQTHLFQNNNTAIGTIIIFSIVALTTLLIACINFMNLATARSMHRAKEIGIRKVVGAKRAQLMKQFFSESIVFASIAFLVALLLVELFLPIFNKMSAKQLTIHFLDIQFILGSIGIILFTGILAGSYPAFFHSAFKTLKVLKGYSLSGKRGSRLRKILVILQFASSILFIICITVYYQQSRHMEQAFKKDNIVYIPIKGGIGRKYPLIKNELLKNSDILNVTTSSHMPFSINNFRKQWGNHPNEINDLAGSATANLDYLETFDLKMAKGRFFSKDFPSDKKNAVVINETAQKKLGLSFPIGQPFYIKDKKYQIIGVVKDFYSISLRFLSGPIMLTLNPGNDEFMFVKMKPSNTPQSIQFINRICKQFVPGYPLEINSLSDYEPEEGKILEIASRLLLYFTGLAIFISCLGLLGLTSFMTEKRTKEIGIRKVLGDTIAGIMGLFTKEFLKLIIIANIIAWPVAYLLMNQFLEIFARRIGLDIWIFLLTGILVSMLALLMVGFQAYKATRTNPVEVLRFE